MSCHENIIGLDGCEPAAPSSGLKLNQLGINLTLLDSIVQDDYINGHSLFEAQRDLAWAEIKATIYTKFSRSLKEKSILDGARIGIYQENLQSQAAAAINRGVQLKLNQSSSYATLHISKIQFFGNYTGNVVVKVYDVIQGRQIDTLTIASIAGELSETVVNKTYESDRHPLNLAFLYNATAIPSYQSTVKNGGCAGCSAGKFVSCSPFIEARAVEAALGTIIQNNISGKSYTGGLSLIYSINCNYEAWLCSIANVIGLPLLYKTAAQIRQYQINAARFNDTTTIDIEKAEAAYKQNEAFYVDSIEQLLRNINLPSDRFCFSCRQQTKTGTMLPG